MNKLNIYVVNIFTSTKTPDRMIIRFVVKTYSVFLYCAVDVIILPIQIHNGVKCKTKNKMKIMRINVLTCEAASVLIKA